jgi:hypothetical protein
MVFVLSTHGARPFHRIESLHSPGHPVKNAMPGTAIKETLCNIKQREYLQPFFRIVNMKP